MPEPLSPAARTRLASIIKQLKSKVQLPRSDSRLAAVVYAIYVCQVARKNGDNRPRLMSAAKVALPGYLSGVSVMEFFWGEEAEGSDSKHPIAYRAPRLINDVVTLNAGSLDFLSKDKLAANWMEQSSRELTLQLLLLDKIADPSELIELDPRLPSLVFGQLMQREVEDPEQPSTNVPASVAKLIACAFPVASGRAALDLTFGLGEMTAAALGENASSHFFAQEADALNALLGWLRIQIMPGADSASVKIGDPLTHAFANLADTRPVDLAYVYHIEPAPKGELLRFLTHSTESNERIVSLWEVAKKRLKQSEAELEQLDRERDVIAYRKEDESRVARPAAEREAVARELESRLKDLNHRRENLREMKNHLRGEFEEIDARLNTLRREMRTEGLSLHRNDGRDLKLIRHSLETVTPTGSVVAVVSGRNLLRPQSVRALRAYLTTEQNWLDTVVELPRGIAGAGERVAMLVFRKGRRDKDVLFIDASRIDAVVKAGSEDSVIDIAAQESTVVRRQRLEELPEAYVDRLVEIIRDRVEYDGVSAKLEASVALGESDLRPQPHLRALGSARVTVEKLFQMLAASVEQTRKASAALQASRAALGLAPLNPQSGPAAPRPSGN